MPMSGTPYAHMLLDPSSLESDLETNDPVIVVCRRCRSGLMSGRVPPLSLANRNYLGPVPQALRDLTVVEEAMISLCRAKCWIIQLREEGSESSIPISQRGVRGHIIVYPQRSSSVALSLPPSLEEIITPICVIFVIAALSWLKVHNHLYRDIPLNQHVLDSLPAESILPFHVEHVVPNAGIDITTSDYIPGSSEPPAAPLSVVVTDVDGNAPANELRAAAVAHMKKPGSNYVEIPHDPHPSQEFRNPHLFPMMYRDPTLFPYGLGGFEDKDRRTRLGFKRHVKHLFNLADRRFQEHYSFPFTAFNMIQRRALLLRTKFKVKRPNFDNVAAKFGTVSPTAVHIVSERIAAGDTVTANSAEEKRVLRLMKEVNLISSHVPGSAQSKLVMRNEIRALMVEKGLSSFYIKAAQNIVSLIWRTTASCRLGSGNVVTHELLDVDFEYCGGTANESLFDVGAGCPDWTALSTASM
ncbi:hypothetical protein B0H13DRAFT_1856544 [Mycena leptocephala]|nr:hypothetical protein B0H13DRAFT_1856544 [Mycena leptocephala]